MRSFVVKLDLEYMACTPVGSPNWLHACLTGNALVCCTHLTAVLALFDSRLRSCEHDAHYMQQLGASSAQSSAGSNGSIL